MIRKAYKGILLFTCLLCSNAALAELAVQTKSWPKQLPESEHGPQNYYGNGKVEPFDRAIRGSDKYPMTAEEQKSIDKMMPESETNRWYLKVGMYKGTTKINSVKNKSTATHNGYDTATLNTTKSSKDITGGQIGVGYMLDQYRFDVDYMFGNTGVYDPAPLFTSNYGVLTSKITGHHLIANAYYELQNLIFFKPFAGISLGIGRNTVASTFTNTGLGAGNDGVEKSKSVMGIDYGLQAGARIKIYKTRFYASASYRYLSLGKAKWTDNSGTVLLEGSRAFNGFCLDLIYLL